MPNSSQEDQNLTNNTNVSSAVSSIPSMTPQRVSQSSVVLHHLSSRQLAAPLMACPSLVQVEQAAHNRSRLGKVKL